MRAARLGRLVGCAAVLALLPTAAIGQVMHATCPDVALGDEHVGAPPIMTFTSRMVAGGRILVAEGGIDASTPAALQSALAAHAPIAELWLRSGGGNAVAGNRTAEILRDSGVPIRIPSGWWCISACNFMFFGGALRMIDPGGQFGVHMATVVSSRQFQEKILALAKAGAAGNLLEDFAELEQSMAMLTADDIDTILRMGISRKLLSDVMYAQRADEFRDEDGDGRYDLGRVATFRCLTQAEMRRYNVINVD